MVSNGALRFPNLKYGAPISGNLHSPLSLLRRLFHPLSPRLFNPLPQLDLQAPPRSFQLRHIPSSWYPRSFPRGRAILSDPARDFHSSNTPLQNLVFDYSIAYFLMDLLHYLIFYPTDLLFIGHHLATLFVFLTCRYLVCHGAVAILVLLVLAELTSFCQNVWTLASARRSDVDIAAKVFDLLSPPFYALYSLVRGFFGPYSVYRMITFYVTGAADAVIPKWVWISWLLVVVTDISVSMLWIVNLWAAFFRDKEKKSDKKLIDRGKR